MKKLSVVFIAVVVAALTFSISVNDIVKASSNLKAVKLQIYAENHIRGRKSVVEFNFWYQRDGKKMRIEYISPRNMKGTIVAIDGEYFYNYIPSLNKKIKKKLTPGAKNPGKDMGVLYNYVLGDLQDVFKKSKVSFVKEDVLNIDKKQIKCYLFDIKQGQVEQKVWFDSEDLFPVKIEIYDRGKIKVVLLAKEVTINPEIDQSIFSPF